MMLRALAVSYSHSRVKFQVLLKAHGTFCDIPGAVRDTKITLPVVMCAASCALGCLML